MPDAEGNSRRRRSSTGAARRPCCLVSEVLEEAGLDRRRARQIRRQVLEGLILLCRWQLERMGPEPEGPRRKQGPRKVVVE